MNHKLGRLLNSSGKLFEMMIADLEGATGSAAVDVNLVGQILTQGNAKLRQLGFVDSDVTVTELRQALQQKYQQTKSGPLVEALQTLNVGSVYELSKPLMIRILQTLPPTGLMRRMGAMTVNDLTEKLTDEEILISSIKTETADWQHKFNQQVATLERGYFDFMPLKVEVMTEKMSEIFSNQPILYHRLSATIFVSSADDLSRLVQLAAVLKQRLLWSNQLAMILSARHFHAQLQKWLIGEPNHVWTLSGNAVPRSSFYSAATLVDSPLNQRIKAEFSEFYQKLNSFDTHLWLVNQLDDDFWTANEALATDLTEAVVSFNLLDIGFSILSKQPETRFFEEALWNLLVKQYLQSQNLADQLFLQLESNLNN